VTGLLFGEDGLVSGFLPEGTDMQTVEDIQEGVDYNPCSEISNMVTYLEEHEDIKGIEYMGEIKNRDELEEIEKEILEELYPEEAAEAATE